MTPGQVMEHRMTLERGMAQTLSRAEELRLRQTHSYGLSR